MAIGDIAVMQVIRNDDLPIQINFLTSAGVVIDITGCTVFFTVKTSNTDADAAAKIAKSWNTHLDATNGVTTFSLVPADTTSLLGSYSFDIQLKTLAGLIYTPVRGIFIVLSDSTIRIT
jgi:hypothetical protein